MEKRYQRRTTSIKVRAQAECSGHFFDEHENWHEGLPTLSNEIEFITLG